MKILFVILLAMMSRSANPSVYEPTSRDILRAFIERIVAANRYRLANLKFESIPISPSAKLTNTVVRNLENFVIEEMILPHFLVYRIPKLIVTLDWLEVVGQYDFKSLQIAGLDLTGKGLAEVKLGKLKIEVKDIEYSFLGYRTLGIIDYGEFSASVDSVELKLQGIDKSSSNLLAAALKEYLSCDLPDIIQLNKKDILAYYLTKIQILYSNMDYLK